MLALSHISSRFAFSSITSQLDHVVGARIRLNKPIQNRQIGAAMHRWSRSQKAIGRGEHQGLR
ncbi:hypothetical protein ABIC71_004091 [Herbaspirillum seropedicae]|jgi:hypothetical protein|uniref:hypothetical protein n=1 Tax=Herbaspirillum seropedicae TaxID=964 RepID=UPI0033996A33